MRKPTTKRRSAGARQPTVDAIEWTLAGVHNAWAGNHSEPNREVVVFVATKPLPVLAQLTRTFFADCKSCPPHIALLRALRACRILVNGDARAALFDNAAYLAHVRAVAATDEMFFLSHRYFLARGLTAGQRIAAAICHYGHEMKAFDPAYFAGVYRGSGLVLWQARTEGGEFDLVLQPGNDVLYEGGLSVVFRHQGQRVCVMSYSMLPSSLFASAENGRTCASPPLLFVTRKQAGADHRYQREFNRAFDRTTVGHMCFAALSGIALAQGHGSVFGIAADVHPSAQPEHEGHFRSAYDGFWHSLQGVREARLGYRVPVPMQMTPLDSLDGRHRKRAIARRAHLDEVCSSAQQAIKARLSTGVPPR